MGISPIRVALTIHGLLICLCSFATISCSSKPDTDAISIETVNFPAQNRWLVSTYNSWAGSTFAGLAWQMRPDGTYIEGSGKLLQTYSISEHENSHSIEFIAERLQTDLERVLLVQDDNSTISLADRHGEDPHPYLIKDGEETEEYQLPSNFQELYGTDLTGGRKVKSSQSVYMNKDGEFLLVKTVERHVKQLWIGSEVMRELELPSGNLRVCKLCDQIAEYPGMIDEQGLLYAYSNDRDAFEQIENMEWLSSGLAEDDLLVIDGRLDLVVSRNIAAINDAKHDRICLFLGNGETASLTRFDPFEEVPGGGRRSEEDANILLALPMLHLMERSKLDIDQYTRSAVLMAIDDDSIAVIDDTFQRMLVVSPKAEATR